MPPKMAAAAVHHLAPHGRARGDAIGAVGRRIFLFCEFAELQGRSHRCPTAPIALPRTVFIRSRVAAERRAGFCPSLGLGGRRFLFSEFGWRRRPSYGVSVAAGGLATPR